MFTLHCRIVVIVYNGCCTSHGIIVDHLTKRMESVTYFFHGLFFAVNTAIV